MGEEWTCCRSERYCWEAWQW